MGDRITPFKIALGTVQFGIPYGISNQKGKVAPLEVKNILETALDAGISTLDTAAAYGTAETAIGNSGLSAKFKIVGKFHHSSLQASSQDVLDQTQTSLGNLKLESLYGLLCHHEDLLLGNEGESIWHGLEKLKTQGLVENIGFSSYEPQKLVTLLKRFPVDMVQVPYNILDQRFFSPEIKNLYQENKIKVHTRSTFLQGLFFLDPHALPPQMKYAQDTLDRLQKLALKLDARVADLSLSLAIQNPLVESVVLGVTSSQELEELLAKKFKYFSSQADEELSDIISKMPSQIIDPRTWK